MPTTRRIKKMTGVLKNRQPDLTVVCENIHDPHNVSAILRSCDAVGVEKVHLIYSSQEFPGLGKKSSASAKKWIEVGFFSSCQEARSLLKAQGFTIYATCLNEQAQSIYDVDWTTPAAIVVGNEHDGVSAEAREIADALIFIPMFGMIQSLNVSVATAVILYEACRQRMIKGIYPHPFTPPEKLAAMLEKWIEK